MWGFLFFLALIFTPVIVFNRVMGVRHFNKTAEPSIVVRQIETDNPWLQRVFKSPLYGMIPAKCAAYLSRVSADKDEKVFGAVFTNHGRWNLGYLIATTDYLRWVQIFPFREDEHWPYNFSIESLNMGTILNINGDLFQIRGLSKAKQFRELYRNIQQGLEWQRGQAAPVQPPAAQSAQTADNGGLTGELGRLAELHKSGILNKAEFETAKKRVLEGPSKPTRRV